MWAGALMQKCATFTQKNSHQGKASLKKSQTQTAINLVIPSGLFIHGSIVFLKELSSSIDKRELVQNDRGNEQTDG